MARKFETEMGLSLLIAIRLIVAIRTARWAATHDSTTSSIDLDREIGYAARVTHTVLATLIKTSPFTPCGTIGRVQLPRIA